MFRQKHAKRYSQEFKETLIDFYHSGQSVVQLSGLMSIKAQRTHNPLKSI